MRRMIAGSSMQAMIRTLPPHAALRPGHGDVALGGICVAIALFCSPPSSSRRDGGAMGAVGGKHAVVPDEVDARFGDERSQGQSCPDRGWRIVTAKPLSVFG